MEHITMDSVNDNPTSSFWLSQDPTPQGMMLNHRAAELDEPEQAEILGYLPNLMGKHVLELGSGIGRYTKHLAVLAHSVLAVDFIDRFVEQNKLNNEGNPNISHICCNVMNLDLPEQSIDFVFINWLLMYLADEEVELLVHRIDLQLREGGALFIRESCNNSSNPSLPHPNTYYRDQTFYENLLLAKFKLLLKGNIKVYEKVFSNPNQIFWVLHK